MKYQETHVNDSGGIKTGVFKSKGGPGLSHSGQIPKLKVKRKGKLQKDPSQFVPADQINLNE